MIEILSKSQGNTLGVRLSARATITDYDGVFVPALVRLFKEYAKIRLLFVMDAELAYLEPYANWHSGRFGLMHKHEFERLAVVGIRRWAFWAGDIAKQLADVEMRYFPEEKINLAWQWIKR